MKRLIVGVDPGVTVGLAALSLDSSPVFVDSKRDWKFSDLVKTVSELGEPTVIASDVSPASELLEKLSHNFNAVLHAPSISMAADEKHQMAKAYAELHGLKLKNAHEVDALAAALKAYNSYTKKLERVEATMKKQSCELPVDAVKDLVVRGYTVKRAIQTLQASKKVRAPPVVERPVPETERLKRLAEELRDRLVREKERSKILKEGNRGLQLQIKDLKKKISGFEEKIASVRSEQSARTRREREYALLIDELKQLRAKLREYSTELEAYKQRFNQMQRLRELESQGRLVLLKPIEVFTEVGLEKAFGLFGVRAGDLVLLLDPSGGGATTAETLARRSVKVIVARGSMSHHAVEVFAKYMIPVVQSERLRIEWIEGLPYADSESLRAALRELEQREVAKAYDEVKTIVEDHRKKMREQTQDVAV